ncbi:MAG: primosomal protein N' [bacterium]|nr:primosomal protein N' [bacterium]
MRAIEVAISTPPYTCYHYLSGSYDPEQIMGCAVTVPFGSQRKPLTGWVWNVSDAPPTMKLKAIQTLVSPTSLFPGELLPFLRWFSQYYFAAPGIVCMTAQPPGDLSGTEKSRLEIWSSFSGILPEELPKRLSSGTLALLSDLTTQPAWELHSERILRTGATKNAAERLAALGILIKELRPPWHRDPSLQGIANTAPPLPPLTDDQQKVFTELLAKLTGGSFHSSLLFGVTGSGKTRVYLELTKQTLSVGKSVLLIVPEIAMTPQLIGWFRSAFGSKVRVLHSKMTDASRRGTYQELRTETASIVIGARSALFAPVRDLGLIVVDEEHEASLKQHDPEPRYHARDAALMRAKFANCLIVLGSATPSIEILHGAETGKHTLHVLPERVDNVPLPTIHIVDMNEVPRSEPGRVEVLSPQLIAAIENRIERAEQVILMRNRRGYGTHLRCGKCNWVMGCPNCSVTLTVHREYNEVICHLCGHHEQIPVQCPQCNSARVAPRGFGTERVEEYLAEKFPALRVLRMDGDTVKQRGSHQRILQAFADGEADLLLGTRMIARSLDFPRVTLVGILSADSEWLLPDFRSEERALSLLMQAAGRAGRRGLGEVVLQTWDPHHIVLQYLQAHDWQGFAEYTMKLRKQLEFPPFVRLARILVTGPEENAAELEANRLQKWLQSQGFDTSHAAPALIARKENYYRFAILLKLALQDTRRMLLGQLPKPLYSENRIALDIDPIDFS